MRILYNTTFLVDKSITIDWLDYVKNIYVNLIMDTKCFDEWKLSRIYGEQNENGISFALQFVAKDFDNFVNYRDNFSKGFQTKMETKFKEKCMFFKTLMEIIEES